jgi:SAM-dependent methyltransferase
VGCGEGFLTRELGLVVPRVTAIDRDAPSIERARRHPGPAGIDYINGDFLSHDLPACSFDLVASVAVLHHLDLEPALARMRELLRPAGTLAAVGLARSSRPAELIADCAGVVVHRAYRLTKDYMEQTSPVVWPPPLTYRQVREAAAKVLPGARYRRHVLWRYSLVWTKPGLAGSRAAGDTGGSPRPV